MLSQTARWEECSREWSYDGVFPMTRRTLFVLAATPALAAGSEDELSRAEKAWAAAVTALDYAALGRILGDNLIYAHSTGVVENKAEYLGKLKSGVQKYDGIEHASMTVKLYGEAGVVHSQVRMRGASKGKPFDDRLMMLHLWVRQGGRWRLAAHQTTRLQ